MKGHCRAQGVSSQAVVGNVIPEAYIVQKMNVTQGKKKKKEQHFQNRTLFPWLSWINLETLTQYHLLIKVIYT